MATTQSTASSDGGMQKKTVTVIAYAANDAFKSERAMADALDASRDYYARERNVDETTKLVVERDDGHTTSESLMYDTVAEAVRAAAIDSDVLSVEHERDVSRPYAHSPHAVVNDTRDELASQLPDELSGGVTRGLWTRKWSADDRETKVQIRGGKLDYRRILAHRSRRNGRRKYDSQRKRLSMDFTIELGPEEDHVVDAWNDSVVEPFVTMLTDVEWVERVRVADCTETVERQGDCFDL